MNVAGSDPTLLPESDGCRAPDEMLGTGKSFVPRLAKYLFSNEIVLPVLRRKLRHHKTARIIVLAGLMGLALTIMFLGMYFLITVLSPLTRYGPGQLFNPFRLGENLVIGLFFFLMIWKMPTVNQSLTWSLILLSLYNGGYIPGFISDTIFFRTSGPIDIAVGLMHGLALVICGFVLLRPLDAREAIRVVYGTALFSWAITVVSYVTFYGPEVGIGRALVTGVLGPFIVIIRPFVLVGTGSPEKQSLVGNTRNI